MGVENIVENWYENPVVLLLAAITVGLVQIVKQFNINKKWYPIIAIFIGIALSFAVLFVIFKYSISETVISGVIIGLSASGLFSGIKNSLFEEDIND